MDSNDSWKQLKLSLERPYKDDCGDSIPVVEDITPDLEYIYETKENPSARLGANLRRIFLERGYDFLDKVSGNNFTSEDSQTQTQDITETPSAGENEDDDESKTTTYEDLRGMRDEILRHLQVSFGEMTQAQQVLASLLTSSSTDHQPQTQNQSLSQTQSQSSSQAQASQVPVPSVSFSATLVTKPPAITSVQAFNAQLSIGGKDEALRHAADLFKASAASMERTRLAGERYWVNALKIRRNNWGLVPAPLPPGSATGKGADKTSKDFLISYGLEESPSQFRRRAVGRLPSYSAPPQDIIFPHRRRSRLCVSIITKSQTGATHTMTNTPSVEDKTVLDESLRSAQREIVEQEIFSILVLEAGSLPTASAKVSERLIVVDAAQGLELQIELADDVDVSIESPRKVERSELCDLIYFGFHILLLRRHALLKEDRLSAPTATQSLAQNATSGQGEKQSKSKYPILQPIIDLLQYQVFLNRIRSEMTQVVRALQAAGIPTQVSMDIVGETGKELVKLLESKTNLSVGGEIILRIFDRHTIRFTFVSPSTLVAHLSQSTLNLSSIPQLCQLLMDEVEQCLLSRILDHGKGLTENMEGTWFIDLDHCVGRWEGCVINFRITYGLNYSINCTAYLLRHPPGKPGQAHFYPPRDHKEQRFLEWVDHLIKVALEHPSSSF